MLRHFIPLLLSLGLYLGLHNGHLAIFDTDQAFPLAVLPYSADLYPAQDSYALEQGIPFEKKEDLAQLLEDFLS